MRLVAEKRLGGDDVAVHAYHFDDAGHAPLAVARSVDLHDEIDGRSDLRTERAARCLDAAHGDDAFEARERFARPAGVNRAERAVMAAIHRLQHVERLGATNL